MTFEKESGSYWTATEEKGNRKRYGDYTTAEVIADINNAASTKKSLKVKVRAIYRDGKEKGTYVTVNVR